MPTRLLPLAPLVLALSALGCDPAADDSGEAFDPAAHACEHMAEAGEAVTAGATMDTTAPAIDLSGEGVYTVTLVDGAPGYLRYESAEEHELIVFLDLADVMQAAYVDGTEATLPAPSANPDCPSDLADHYHLDVEPGTWHLELGPAAVDTVWLMLVEGDGHDHQDE